MKIFAALLVWIGSISLLNAVTLLWNRNPETNVIGYRIHWGTNGSRMYDRVVDVGNLITGKVRTGQGMMHWFAITAYDSDGLESGYSAEVTYYHPPYTNTPRFFTMRVPANKWWIQRGPQLNSVTNWFSVTGPTNITVWATNGPSMFLTRQAFFTSLAKTTTTKGAGAKAQMAKKAPVVKKKTKLPEPTLPVLGPPRPVPMPGSPPTPKITPK